MDIEQNTKNCRHLSTLSKEEVMSVAFRNGQAARARLDQNPLPGYIQECYAQREAFEAEAAFVANCQLSARRDSLQNP